MGEHKETGFSVCFYRDSSVCLYLYLSLMLCGIYRCWVFKHIFFLSSQLHNSEMPGG